MVVLPAPLGPSKPKISPSFTLKEMWSTAVSPLNLFVRLLVSIIASLSKGCHIQGETIVVGNL